jgi:hypothetical protein
MGQALLSDLDITSDIQDDGDFIGGNIWDSGIYNFIVKEAYLVVSKSGAKAISFVFAAGNRKYKETVYFTSNAAKGGKAYYVKDNVKKFLPGYSICRSIALLTVGKELPNLVTEKKVVNIYDYTTKEEIPTEVDMFVDLLEKPISLGIICTMKNKQKKGQDGKYHDTAETREENNIDKAFRTRDGLTVTEVIAKKTTPEFKEKWDTTYTGVVQDKVKNITANAGTAGGFAGAAGTPSTDAAALFI